MVQWSRASMSGLQLSLIGGMGHSLPPCGHIHNAQVGSFLLKLPKWQLWQDLQFEVAAGAFFHSLCFLWTQHFSFLLWINCSWFKCTADPCHFMPDCFWVIGGTCVHAWLWIYLSGLGANGKKAEYFAGLPRPSPALPFDETKGPILNK